MTIALSRRAFIQASLSAAGGLAIAAFAPEFVGATTIAGGPWSPESGKGPNEVNAFVVIDPDNSITLRVAKSDMGQGVLTSMAMILAEELECNFAKVKVEYASANRNLTDNNVYQSMGTGGSRSVRTSRVFLQQAGASARARLIAAAAAKWNVEPAACVASDSLVRHTASGRSFTFGELAADAAKVALAAEPAIKTPDQFKLIGQGLKRIDTPLKVTGSARFGIDTRLPGMAYAAVANCPVFGGKLKSYDFSAISRRRGILAAMPVTNGVAVVADNFWRAKEALHAMAVEWDFGPAGSTDSAQFAAEYRAALDGPLADGGGHGDIDTAFAQPARVVEALYEVPYLAHAPMEPLNATAHWQGERIDVWMGTQAPESALAYAAKAGGVDPKTVFVHNCFLGGGFGRRAVNDELTQAVEVSRALKRPIKVVWTREEDIRSDRYRPQAALHMRAALREDGAPAGLNFVTAVGSITRSLGWGKAANGVEPQAVEKRRARCLVLRFLHVALVGRQDLVPAGTQRRRGRAQSAVLLLARGEFQHGSRRACAVADCIHDSGDHQTVLSRTRSSRCTISSRPRNPSNRSISADFRPRMRAVSASEYAQMPRATSTPPGPTMLTVSPRSKRPMARVTPAGSKLLPCISARTAPSSTEIAPAGRKVPAIHCLRAAVGVEDGRNQVQRAPSSMRFKGCGSAPLAMHK